MLSPWPPRTRPSPLAHTVLATGRFMPPPHLCTGFALRLECSCHCFFSFLLSTGEKTEAWLGAGPALNFFFKSVSTSRPFSPIFGPIPFSHRSCVPPRT